MTGLAKILPGTGRWQSEGLTEGVSHVAPPLHHASLVPLPVNGEEWS